MQLIALTDEEKALVIRGIYEFCGAFAVLALFMCVFGVTAWDWWEDRKRRRRYRRHDDE